MASSSVRQQAEARVGTLLDGKWTLETFLGYGGSAAVYGATHRNGKRGAVKVLHAHCAADGDLVTRFLREGYLANKIAHPGVVSVLDDDRAPDGTVYLVMELLEGRSFERHGRGAAPPLTVLEAMQVADELLDVLVAAHTMGLVHRDIKPANIFLTLNGQLKVLDFGIARLAEASHEGATQTGMLMGTPAFMPPEQARGRWQEVDARSDIWAVGVTLSALLTGRRPRTADTPAEELLAAMMQPMPSLRTILLDAPPEVVELIDKAYAFERADRWQSALEMQAAVRAIKAQLIEGGGAPSVTMRFAPELHPAPQAGYLSGGEPRDPTPPPTGQRGHYSGSTMLTPPPATYASAPPDQLPSLTTNRASVSARTAPPPSNLAAPRRASSKAPAVVGAMALVACVCLIGGGALFMKTRAHGGTASTAANAPPVVVTNAPSEAVTVVPAAAPVTPSAPVVSADEPSSADAGAAAAAAKKPVGRGHGAPKGTADPSKIFDERF